MEEQIGEQGQLFLVFDQLSQVVGQILSVGIIVIVVIIVETVMKGTAPHARWSHHPIVASATGRLGHHQDGPVAISTHVAGSSTS